MNHSKRGTSVSVDEIHSLQESIKRVAISIDGKAKFADKPLENISSENSEHFLTSDPIQIHFVDSEPINGINQQLNSKEISTGSSPPQVHKTESPKSHFALKMPTHQNNNNMVSIMSKAKENFTEIYKVLEEIGRGGFSTVYKCMNKMTQQIYAVKVVDLRPLRLRERFNPNRIRREVCELQLCIMIMNKISIYFSLFILFIIIHLLLGGYNVSIMSWKYYPIY
jgi:hypothetical protein